MKVTGIICEYNPFHNGHLHHIQKARELTNCDCLVVILSGNYVQRGDFSILNKWEKTKLALEYGCDLVIELPTIYTLQSAQYFAMYTTKLLELANVDSIVFGSESNNFDLLHQQVPKNIIRKNGNSWRKQFNIDSVINSPNDILGINYLRYLSSKITPYIIQRTNNYHGSELSTIASASAIRHNLKQNKNVDIALPYQYVYSYRDIEEKFELIRHLILTKSKEELASFFLIDEGMPTLFIKAAKNTQSYSEFLQFCASKRYTHSTIRRALMHLLLNNTKQLVDNLPELNYLRVLGFNKIGQQHLKKLQTPIIATNIKQIPEPFRSLEIKASYVYYNNSLPKFELEKPIIKK